MTTDDRPVTRAEFDQLAANVEGLKRDALEWRKTRAKIADELRRHLAHTEAHIARQEAAMSRTTNTTVHAEGATPREALDALLEDPLGPAMTSIMLRSDAASVAAIFKRELGREQPERWVAEATVSTNTPEP